MVQNCQRQIHADAAGSPLAAKLIGMYFMLFHLVLEGKVGHSAEAEKKREAEKQSKGKSQKKKTGKKAKHPHRSPKNGAKPKPSTPAGSPAASVSLFNCYMGKGEIDFHC